MVEKKVPTKQVGESALRKSIPQGLKPSNGTPSILVGMTSSPDEVWGLIKPSEWLHSLDLPQRRSRFRSRSRWRRRQGHTIQLRLELDDLLQHRIRNADGR